MTQILIAGLLLFAILHNEADAKQAYCNYLKHEFYLPQGDFCKKCDRCIPGFGLQTLKDQPIEIRPNHGAMECQKCVMCGAGHFSKSRSYKDCRICRDCAKEGRFELKPCTLTSNTKCGGKLAYSEKDSGVSLVGDGKMKDNQNNIALDIIRKRPAKLVEPIERQKSIEAGVIVPIASVILIIMVAALSIVGVAYFCKRKATVADKKAQTSEFFNRQYKEKAPMLQPFTINMGCDDLEVDSPRSEFDIWKSKNGIDTELKEEHMVFLSKLIATENTFQTLGIKLGIPVNEIDIIKTDYAGKVVDQAFNTLNKWRRMQEGSKVIIVLENLIAINRRDIVEKFCKRYQ